MKYKLLPCSIYETERFGRWLDSCAEKGETLSKEGFILGTGIFEKNGDRDTRYRVCDIPPDEEGISLMQNAGYEYICEKRPFYIYSYKSGNAGEIYTDTELYESSLKKLYKKLIWDSSLSAFFIFLYAAAALSRGALMLITAIGSALFFSAALIVLICVFSTFSRAVYIKKQIKLFKSEKPREKKNEKFPWYSVINIVVALFIILWGAGFAKIYFKNISGKYEQPLSAYSKELPFCNIGDFKSGEYKLSDLLYSNTVKETHDILFPLILNYREASAVSENGSTLSGGLVVDYYKCASKELAINMAKELYASDKHSSSFALSDEKTPECADFAVIYDTYFTTLVMAKGNTAVRAMFYNTSDIDIPIKEWTNIFAESVE